MRKTNNERIVDKFDSSDFYVIVKKGNTELLNEINEAGFPWNTVKLYFFLSPYIPDS